MTVPLPISDAEFIPGVMGNGTYAPLLDMRRRIIANAWARRGTVRGPLDPTLRLAQDSCREHRDTSIAGLPCTSVPTGDRDRLELYWGWDYNTPEDARFFNEFNGGMWAIPLTVAAEGGSSLHFPGLHFRFFSGPAARYPGTPRWSAVSPAPTGEDTGFEVNQIELIPNGTRGFTSPLMLTAYERATVVLVGGPSGTRDSVHFLIDPGIEQPTIAAWIDPGSAPVRIVAQCGSWPPDSLTSPNPGAWVSGENFLDLTGECTSMWHVSVVNYFSGYAVAQVRVGAATPGRSWSNIRVGIESAAPAAEVNFIKQTVREAALRLYGMTGGSHLVRSLTYNPPGACSNVTLCWRNRPAQVGCANGNGSYAGGGSLGTVHLCQDTLGRTPAVEGDVTSLDYMVGRGSATLLAHEFGHLFTGTSAFNYLGDEYWSSNSTSPICGQTGVGLRRCTHTTMSFSWSPDINSLCVARNHDAASEVFRHNGGFDFTLLGVRSGGAGGFETSVAECSGSATEFHSPHGNPGWATLANNGAAAAHPSWSPDNHDFVNFTFNSSATFIGRNLP